MKFVLLGLFLVGISAVANAEDKTQHIVGAPHLLKGIPDIINGILTKLLDTLRSAIPDPLQIAKVNISFPADNPAISGYFNLTDILETGLKQFETKAVNVSLIPCKLNIILDAASIIFNSEFDQDMLFGSIVPMYGSGPNNFHLKHLNLNLTAAYTLDIFKLRLQLKNTTLITTLGDATFDLHGILNNEAFSILVSQVMNDIVSKFVNEHTALISKILSPIVEVLINNLLSKNKKDNLFEAPSKDLFREMNQEDLHELKKLFIKELGRSNLGKIVSF